MLGSICEHLSKDKALQDQLRQEPALLPAAVEEFIRLYSPYRGFARTVSEETTIHGRTISPGVPITMTYAAANRDPAVFENPNDFIINRPNITAHLGFGRGTHMCAGMPLARLAIQTALSRTSDSFCKLLWLTLRAVLLENTTSFEVNGPLAYGRMPELGITSCPLSLVSR